MENHLLATLSQQQVLSQEQQQSLRILQMPTQELLGEIELMLESNPLLEVEEPAQASDDPQARAQEHDDDRRDDRGEDDSESDAAQAETRRSTQPWTRPGQGASSDEAALRAHSRPRILQGRAARRSRLPAAHAAPASALCRLPCRGARRQGASSRPRSRRSTRCYARILKEEGVENVTAAEWRGALATLQSMDPPGHRQPPAPSRPS